MRPKQQEPQRLPAAISSSPPPPPPFSWYSHHSHERFFHSLRQVEGRLASESSRHGPSPPQQQKPSSSPSSLGSSEKPGESPAPSPASSYSAPLFVGHHRGRVAHPHPAGGPSAGPRLLDSSPDLPPLELFSDSIPPECLPSSPAGGPPSQDDAGGDELEGEVERLMGLLGLSELYQGGVGVGVGVGRAGDGSGGAGACGGWSSIDGGEDCSGFLSRIAGVKGPKCRREMERLDGWVHYYRCRRPLTGGSTEGKKEPARLAHLLIARAASTSRGSDGDGVSDYFGGIGFPVTVEEYLQQDPPAHCSSPS